MFIGYERWFHHPPHFIILLLSLITSILTFEFAPPNIYLTSLIINSASDYTFSIARKYDSNLAITPFDTQLVPSGSTFDFYFPTDYLVLTSSGTTITCDLIVINDAIVTGPFSVTTTGSSGAYVVKVAGAVLSDTAIATATIQLKGVLNPSPAISTGSFVVKIGVDVSAGSTGIALQPALFSLCQATFNPTQVNTTGKIIISSTLTNSLPKNGSLNVKFPVALQWAYDISPNHQLSIQGNLTCQLQNPSSFPYLTGLSCSGSQSTQTVIIHPVFSASATETTIPSGSTLSFSINNLFSPPTTQSVDTIDVTSSYSISGQKYDVDRCTPIITGMTAKALTVSYTATVSPLFVNSAAGFRVSFSVTDSISKTDYFRIEFPLDSTRITYLFKLSSLNLGTTTYDNSTGFITFFRTTSAVDSLIGESHYITFQSYLAPRSTRPTNNIRFVVLSARGFEKYVGNGTITAVEKTYTSTLAATNLSVVRTSNYSISFTLADSLTTTGMIVLTVPLQIAVNSCPQLTPTATLRQSPTCSISNTGSSYTVTMTNLNSTNSAISSGQTVTIIFINIVNYYSSILLPSISLKVYFTSDVIDLVAVSTTNRLTLIPNSAFINSFTILNGNTNTLQQPVQYQITANLQSGMPVASGLIVLNIDPRVKIGASVNTTHQCLCQVVDAANVGTIIAQGTASGTIVSNSGSNIINLRLPSNFTFSQSTPSLLAIKLPLSVSLRNPATTQPISLILSSYDSESSPNLIDAGVSFTSTLIFTPRQITTFSIESRTSSTNFAISSYTFLISISANIASSEYLSGSVANLTLPPQVTPALTSKCYSTAATPADLGCSINGQVFVVPLDAIQVFTFNSPTGSNTLSFRFSISFLTNPGSFQPSDLFAVYLQTSGSGTFYYYGSDTSSLRINNSIAIQFVNMTYQWSSTTYGGGSTSVLVNFQSVTPLLYYISFDVSKFQLQNPLSIGSHQYAGCTSAQIANINCTLIVSNLSTTVRIANKINSIDSSFPSKFSISLTNLLLTPLSPPTTTPNPYLIGVSGFDSASYDIYSSASTIKFEPMCTIPCQTCPSILQPTKCLSCYTDINISSLKYLHNFQCYLQCPTHTFYDSANPNPNSSYFYTCSDCSTNCKQCSLSSSFCTICPTNNFRYQHIVANSSISECVAICPSTTFSQNIVQNNVTIPSCLPCVSPCLDCVTTNQTCLSCLNTFFSFRNVSSNNSLSCLVICPFSITISNLTSMNCDYCLSPCATCDLIVSNCTTCAVGFYQITNQLLNDVTTNSTNQTLYGYSCLSACPPQTLVINATVCQLCTAPCFTCNNSLTSCLTCVSNYFLSLVTPHLCVQTCEIYYFSNATSGACQLCSSIASLNCLDCASPTQCNKCDDPLKQGYVYLPSNKSCLPSVPDGYFNNSGTAVACTNNCHLCSLLANNCTSCTGNYSLFIDSSNLGSCLAVCPSTYTTISNICQKCQSPCLQCMGSLTNCSTCLSEFYSFNGVCIQSYQCPLYYYINETSKTCSACQSPCSACTNFSFCLTCSTGVLFQSTGQCLTSCPAQYASSLTSKTINGTTLNNIKICLLCLSPCLTCSILRQNCTTCITGYYFYQQINRCFLPCPSGITVPATINSTFLFCLPCVSPCRTCTTLVNTCITCIQNHYLEINSSNCVTTCAVGQYPANGVCNLCISPCLTCSSSTICASCVAGTYFYANKCVTTCPQNLAIIISGTCTECEPGCNNCSSANSISSSLCYDCSNPYALYKDHCYTICPNQLILYLNTSQNKYYCLTAQEYAAAQLGVTLNTQNLLPLPFTVMAAFLCIATFMSKIQSRGTYIVGVFYCWFGILEVGVLVYFLFGVYSKVDTDGNRIKQFKQDVYTLGIISLSIIGVLNILGLFIHTCYLLSDRKFRAWSGIKQNNKVEEQQHQTKPNRIRGSKIKIKSKMIQDNPPEEDEKSDCCSHKCTFITVTVFSALLTYKLKLVLFTGLFKLTGLSYPLQSVHKFRIFNVFSFLGMLHEGFVFYIVYLIAKEGISYADNSLLFLETVDLIIIFAANFILAILSVKKDDDFFQSLLVELDEQEIIDAQEEEKKQMQAYLKEQKQKQIKKRLTSLHPDFIGMDSYHSLKNGQNQESVEQLIDNQELVSNFPQSNIQKNPSKISQRQKLQNKNSLGIYSARGSNRHELDIEDEQLDEEVDDLKYTSENNHQSEVNHNIMSLYRQNRVTNNDWVEVGYKKQEDSGDIEQQDKTITIMKKGKQSKIRSRIINFGDDQQQIIKKAQKPPIFRISGPSSKNVSEISYFGRKPQSYNNILYKQSVIAASNVQVNNEKVTNRQQLKLPDNKNSIKTHSNKTLSVYEVGKTSEKPSASNQNNKAVIFSEVSNDVSQLNFVPILPFIHQDGQLKYLENRQDIKDDEIMQSQKIFLANDSTAKQRVSLEKVPLEVNKNKNQKHRADKNCAIQKVQEKKKDIKLKQQHMGIRLNQKVDDINQWSVDKEKEDRKQIDEQNISIRNGPQKMGNTDSSSRFNLKKENELRQKLRQVDKAHLQQQQIREVPFKQQGKQIKRPNQNHLTSQNKGIGSLYKPKSKHEFQQQPAVTTTSLLNPIKNEGKAEERDGKLQVISLKQNQDDDMIEEILTNQKINQNQDKLEQNFAVHEEPNREAKIAQEQDSAWQTKMKRQPIYKHYIYKNQKEQAIMENEQGEEVEVNLKIQQRQVELDKIQNNIRSSSRVTRNKRSKQKLVIQLKNEENKRLQNQTARKKVAKLSQSIQIGEHQIKESNEQVQYQANQTQNQELIEINVQKSQKQALDTNEKVEIASEINKQKSEIKQNNDEVSVKKYDTKSMRSGSKKQQARPKQDSLKKEQHDFKQSQVVSSIDNDVKKKLSMDQLKNMSHGDLDRKLTIIDNLSENHSHNLTNLKPFEFDQSSLKKQKFQFQEESEEKLSNPFDGSVHESSCQVLNELQDGNDSNGQQEDSIQERHAQVLIKSNNDDTVPLANYHKTNKYNPITEENSDMQMSDNYTIKAKNEIANDDYQIGDEQVQPHSRIRNEDIKDRNLKVLEVLKSTSKDEQMRFKKKKIIPKDQKDEQNIKLQKFDFKAPKQELQKEQSILKKDKFAYPLRLQNRGPNEEDDYHYVDSQQIPQQRSNYNQNPHLERKRLQRVDKRSQSEQQFIWKNQFKFRQQEDEQLPKQIEKQQSEADLVQWKQRFVNVVQQSDRFGYNSSMQVPAKPIVGSSYRDSSQVRRDFEYEQTDKSYHKGKLFLYEQSSNNFQRQSMQKQNSKGRSKSKSRRYSRQGKSRQKSPMSSLQKIYLQKMDKR